jgi:hypothetical protein
MDELAERTPRSSALGRRGFVLGLYAHRAVGGVLLATPIAAQLGAIVGRSPRGDASLFDPGGLELLEAYRLARPSVPGLATAGGIWLALFAFAGLVPMAALLVALGHRGPLSRRFVVDRVLASLGTLSLLWGLAAFAQAVAGGLAFVFGDRFVGSLAWSPPRSDLAHAAVWAVVALVIGALGLVHDLARVVAVDERRGLYLAVARALDTVRDRWAAVPVAYVWRAALGGGALLVGAVAASRVGVATPGRVAVGLVLHQAALFTAVALRASWLAAALRSTRASRPAR